jgi:putative nucleotidyltransferase with HDIG domain
MKGMINKAESNDLDSRPATPATQKEPLDKIDELLDGMENLPSAPQILPPLLRALGEEDADLDRVADMIRLDPALTAKLLNTCNSAFFGCSTKLNSALEAIQQLGFQTVYRIVAAAVGGHIFTPSQPAEGNHPDDWWRHAVLTAFAAQFIAESISADPGAMFTAGLLHDIGKVALIKAYKNDYRSLSVAKLGLTEAQREEWEMSIFGACHGQVGSRLLERWKFSPEITVSVMNHSDPSKVTDAGMQRLAACISLGDALAGSVDSGVAEQSLFQAEAGIAMEILNQSLKDVCLYNELIAENMKFVEAMIRLN